MKHFIISFSHNTGFGNFGQSCEIIPTSKEIIEYAEKQGFKDIVLLNFMRLSEEEYVEYFALNK